MFAGLLGKRWHAHTRPGDPPLTPLDDLRGELESQGCTIVTTDRRAAHVPHDLWAARPCSCPATCRPGSTRSLLAAAGATDHALAPVLRRTRFSNTYRVIARKDPAPRGTGGASAP